MAIDMDFASYPSEYNPCVGYITMPPYNLTLEIGYGDYKKIVKCKEIGIIRGKNIDLSEWGISKEGRDFISLHDAILDNSHALRILSLLMPLAIRSVSYFLSSICFKAFVAVSSRVFSPSSLSKILYSMITAL